MKNTFLFFLTSILGSVSVHAASYTGFATPTSITYHFNGVSLQDASGTNVALVDDSSPFTATFQRSDADFAGVTLKEVAVPVGRYISISICQTSQVDILFDGVKFDGPNGTLFNYQDPLYTVKTDNSTGTISNSAGTGAVTTTMTNSSGCPSSPLPIPVCVTDSSLSGCMKGDVVYTAEGRVKNTLDDVPADVVANVSLKLFLMVDLYDSVAVDSGTGQIAAAPNVQAVVGKPGAAIHMSKSTSSGTANVSMVFADATTMLTTTVSMCPGGAPNGGYIPEICAGQNDANITAAPTGVSVTSGIVFFNIFDPTANSNKGQSQTPTVGSCNTAAECNSVGVNKFSNFIQAVGNNATGICIADSAATPAYLGYTYTGGNGYTGGNSAVNIPIVRVIDPGNIFNICTGSYVNGHTGTCSTVNAGTDGYF